MTKKDHTSASLIEWLGYTQTPDFSHSRWVGILFGFLLGGLALLLLFATAVTVIQFFLAVLQVGHYEADKLGEAVRNIGLVLAALLGAPFIVWRSIVAAKQTKVAEEALFNDKLNNAAQGLAARREVTRTAVQGDNEVILREVEDDLVARAAAIDRLEGLAVERNEAAPRISRLLAAYVRGNFPCTNLEITEPPFTRNTPRMDLQKAIDTLGRIYKIASQFDPSPWRLDLKACNFDGVSFLGGHFSAADFSGSRFEAATFDRGNFEGCWFVACLLNFSSFHNSNLTGARFDRAIINRPIPVAGGFDRSINLGNITGATFIAADISAIDYLGNEQVIAKTFATKDTKISESVKRNMLNADDHARAHLVRRIKDTDRSDEGRDLIRRLEASGFQHWSPYDSSDMATGWLLKQFFDELGMNKWPFVGGCS